jgi:hypothetical protein
MRPWILSFLAALFFTGCSHSLYRRTEVGTFYGELNLQWDKPDRFIFRQNNAEPFYFERANGEKIIPRSIYTDGGSIPRPLWIFRQFSPWQYAPAFVIHDWLFDAHASKEPGYEQYTYREAADVMTECVKTLMLKGKDVPVEPITLHRLHFGVSSLVARWLWDHHEPTFPPPINDDAASAMSRRSVEVNAAKSEEWQPSAAPKHQEAPFPQRAADAVMQTLPRL